MGHPGAVSSSSGSGGGFPASSSLGLPEPSGVRGRAQHGKSFPWCASNGAHSQPKAFCWHLNPLKISLRSAINFVSWLCVSNPERLCLPPRCPGPVPLLGWAGLCCGPSRSLPGAARGKEFTLVMPRPLPGCPRV